MTAFRAVLFRSYVAEPTLIKRHHHGSLIERISGSVPNILQEVNYNNNIMEHKELIIALK